jgi:tubulin polyglutamylase TTLL9
MAAKAGGGTSCTTAVRAETIYTPSVPTVQLADGRRRTRPPGPIRFRTSFRNTIYDVMLVRGWLEVPEEELEESPSGSWDFAWEERGDLFPLYDGAHLEPWQRVCHFRNSRELCRKDLLARNIKRAKKEGLGGFDFTPDTFVLPLEYGLFREEFKRAEAEVGTGGVWIMKPAGRSQGQGIFLLRNLNRVSASLRGRGGVIDSGDGTAPPPESYVVQRYLGDPLCVDGRKFDVRTYALVTCFNPLTVYFYRTGFCRFSSEAYDISSTDMQVHLTNVAIQSRRSQYDATTGKWELSRLREHFEELQGPAGADAALGAMQSVMLRSIQAVAKAIIADTHCFELYGFDILLDSCLKPWLLEVNASPSLTASSNADYAMKEKLLHDMLDLVDMEGRLQPGVVQPRMGGFDLVWSAADGGAVGPPLSLGKPFDSGPNEIPPRVPSAEGREAGGRPPALKLPLATPMRTGPAPFRSGAVQPASPVSRPAVQASGGAPRCAVRSSVVNAPSAAARGMGRSTPSPSGEQQQPSAPPTLERAPPSPRGSGPVVPLSVVALEWLQWPIQVEGFAPLRCGPPAEPRRAWPGGRGPPFAGSKGGPSPSLSSYDFDLALPRTAADIWGSRGPAARTASREAHLVPANG